MVSNIYYDRKDSGLLITSNIEKFYKKMEIGIFPKINYEEIDYEKIDQYNFKDIGLDEIDNDYFQSIKDLFLKYRFETVAFHNIRADLSEVVINTQHLVLGENAKINLSKKNFKSLEEITFLSLKTFKGKVIDTFDSVNKMILWYENKKSNTILEKFPNLKEFYIYNGSLVELDLTGNPKLERLQLHRCTKLEKVVLNSETNLKKLITESSTKLDTSNLLGGNG